MAVVALDMPFYKMGPFRTGLHKGSRGSNKPRVEEHKGKGQDPTVVLARVGYNPG